jgi:1,4-dihydroxy-2-naphthoate octaprenyltransferase
MSRPASLSPLQLWWAGARPRTLAVSICPVVVGTAAAAAAGPTVWWRFAAALVVALALQVGVNYANDYSDGVRGTDSPARIGPVRLTATGLAAPGRVKLAAGIAFAVAAVAGLALAVAVDLRLLLVGAAAIAAAVFYTGGRRPYGYSGLGELSVLVFFGLVATCGSAYVQVGRVPAEAAIASLTMGLLAVAVLLANNVRDVETDKAAGKRTLAVRLGRANARRLYVAVLVGVFVTVVALGLVRSAAFAALVTAVLAVPPARLVLTRADGPGLIAALVGTVRLQLATSLILAVALWVTS